MSSPRSSRARELFRSVCARPAKRTPQRPGCVVDLAGDRGRLCRSRDRSDHRERRTRSARCFAMLEPRLPRARADRDQYFEHSARGAVAGIAPAGQIRRPALLQSRGEPAARRGHPRRRARRTTTLEKAMSFVTQIGKLPLPCTQRAGVRRESPADALHARSAARARGRPLASRRSMRRRSSSECRWGLSSSPIASASTSRSTSRRFLSGVLRAEPPRAAEAEKVAAGELGVKTGRGFYVYRTGAR